MKKVDWQAYLDGQLSAEENAAAEARLREDPAAQRELQGLESFTRSVRESGLTERVPVDRLEAGLGAIVRPRPHVNRVSLPVAACIALLAVAFATYRIIGAIPRVQTYATGEARKSFDDLQSARQWAFSKSGIDAEAPRFNGEGKFLSVHCARGWSCFDYEIDGATVHVYVAPEGKQPKNCDVLPGPSGEIYLTPTGSTATFFRNNLRYTISGCSALDCARLAESAFPVDSSLNQQT